MKYNKPGQTITNVMNQYECVQMHIKRTYHNKRYKPI